MIGESPQALTGELMASRIYSPFAYPVPRCLRIVPIVSIEAERLAAAFPVVWRRGVNGLELVVLRSLMEDGSAFPAGTERTLAALPLVLQAYPFVFPSETPLAGEDNPRLLDVAIADTPTDVGAAIAGPDGRLSRGAELRLRALALFERDFGTTARIGASLDAEGLLVPWPLDFDLGGGIRSDVPDLLVVDPKAFETPRLAPVMATLGAPAAKLVGLHRLSLFRAGILLAAARAVTKTVLERMRP